MDAWDPEYSDVLMLKGAFEGNALVRLKHETEKRYLEYKEEALAEIGCARSRAIRSEALEDRNEGIESRKLFQRTPGITPSSIHGREGRHDPLQGGEPSSSSQSLSQNNSTPSELRGGEDPHSKGVKSVDRSTLLKRARKALGTNDLLLGSQPRSPTRKLSSHAMFINQTCQDCLDKKAEN